MIEISTAAALAVGAAVALLLFAGAWLLFAGLRATAGARATGAVNARYEALLRTAPEVAKFSPGLVLAALSVPEYQGHLLEFGPALVVALAWAAGLVAVAWAGGRRRTG